VLNESVSLTSELLDDIVNRIVATVNPRRIVLFGSAARDQMGPHSDVDILVVMPNGIQHRQTTRQIRRALADLEISKDVVVVTESDVRRFGSDPSLVIRPALAEGKELYLAA
jgi:predicted nucleotidyltransferase